MYAVVNPEPLERDQIEPGLAVPAHRDLHEQPGLVGQLGHASSERALAPPSDGRAQSPRPGLTPPLRALW
jgi:hypothetical protein